MPAVTYEPTAGQRIENACREAIWRARSANAACTFSFNGIRLTALPTGTPEELEAAYDEKCKRRADAYWTPQRIANRDAEQQRDRDRLNAHVATLTSLNWDDLPSVCDWLCEFERLKFIHTPCDSGALLAMFAANGLVPCMCQADDGEDAEVWSLRTSTADKWRYLIGQGLDGIAKVGSPHQIIHTFSERLRNGKF